MLNELGPNEKKSKLNLNRVFSFIGRQFSRIKSGQTYYTIITTTVSSISLITLAFNLDLVILLIFFPILLLSTFVVGFLFDKTDINTQDYLKQVEMANRKVNMYDKKIFDFQIIQLKLLVKAIREGLSESEIEEKYEEYLQKWR